MNADASPCGGSAGHGGLPARSHDRAFAAHDAMRRIQRAAHPLLGTISFLSVMNADASPCGGSAGHGGLPARSHDRAFAAHDAMRRIQRAAHPLLGTISLLSVMNADASPCGGSAGHGGLPARSHDRAFAAHDAMRRIQRAAHPLLGTISFLSVMNADASPCGGSAGHGGLPARSHDRAFAARQRPWRAVGDSRLPCVLRLPVVTHPGRWPLRCSARRSADRT
jgi:hypothetical protein